MKLKDVETGKPYLYETSQYSRESLVIVLDTSTLMRTTTRRWDGEGAAPFIQHDRSRNKPTRSTVGHLALTVYGWTADRLTKEQVYALAAVTANQVALNGFQAPPHLEELGITGVKVELVMHRYLVGDWYEVSKARKNEQKAKERAHEEEALAAELRVERWEKVAEVVERLTGERIYVSSYSEEPEKKISLEIMEQLVERIGSPEGVTGTYGERS